MGSGKHCQTPWLISSGGKHTGWRSTSWVAGVLGGLCYFWSTRRGIFQEKKEKKLHYVVFPLRSKSKRKRSTFIRFYFKLCCYRNICAFTYTQRILGLFWMRSRELLNMRLLLGYWRHKTCLIYYGALCIQNVVMNLIFGQRPLVLKYPGLLGALQP